MFSAALFVINKIKTEKSPTTLVAFARNETDSVMLKKSFLHFLNSEDN